MDFEFDPLKSKANQAKHGIDFVDAVLRLVGLALERVELIFHRVQNPYLFGAEDWTLCRIGIAVSLRWP